MLRSFNTQAYVRLPSWCLICLLCLIALNLPEMGQATDKIKQENLERVHSKINK